MSKSIGDLIRFEHEVQRATDQIARKGILVDEQYATDLEQRLARESKEWAGKAAELGVSNVNANAQITKRLTELGVELTERTPTGQLTSDDKALKQVSEDHPDTEAHALVTSILTSKQLAKRRSAYVVNTLNSRDKHGRAHASINSLGARTTRMSVSNPALQQLPSDESMIRNCYVSEPGKVFITCDYDQIEFRIAGALAGEPKLILAAQKGQSIHDTTARQLYGNEYDDHQYKLGKITGFGFLYGGGAATLSRQADISQEQARQVVERYKEEFPSLAEYKRNLSEQVLQDALTERQYKYYKSLRKQLFDEDTTEERKQEIRSTITDICAGRVATIVTPIGKHIKVEAEYAYRATNYMVQSTARDVMAGALLKLRQVPELMDTVCMVIHDEILAEVPEEGYTLYCDLFSEVMTTDFGPVPLTAKAEYCGYRWGAKYE